MAINFCISRTSYCYIYSSLCSPSPPPPPRFIVIKILFMGKKASRSDSNNGAGDSSSRPGFLLCLASFCCVCLGGNSPMLIRRENINNVPCFVVGWGMGKKWRLASLSASHTWSVCKIIITLAANVNYVTEWFAFGTFVSLTLPPRRSSIARQIVRKPPHITYVPPNLSWESHSSYRISLSPSIPHNYNTAGCLCFVFLPRFERE